MNDLVERIRDLLLKPKEFLPRTVSDPADAKSIAVPYVVLLAAIGPAVSFIVTGLIGVRVFSFVIRRPIMALTQSIFSYALALAAWYFFGWILAALAPSFGGRKDLGGGLKLAAYASTPIWVAGALGLLNIVPLLGSLLVLVASIGALVYAVLITIWGAPILLGTPEDKSVGHALASLGIIVVTYLVVGLIIGAVVAMLFGAATLAGGGHF